MTPKSLDCWGRTNKDTCCITIVRSYVLCKKAEEKDRASPQDRERDKQPLPIPRKTKCLILNKEQVQLAYNHIHVHVIEITIVPFNLIQILHTRARFTSSIVESPPHVKTAYGLSKYLHGNKLPISQCAHTYNVMYMYEISYGDKNYTCNYCNVMCSILYMQSYWETYTAATKRGSESSLLTRISSTPLPYSSLECSCDDNCITHNQAHRITTMLCTMDIIIILYQM